ncbi:putative capsid protein [Duck faeces associated circular DNA virus 1]|uniref:putative capsid protein n=1 Tax=Duck faeces associated circular DNA virus 1 TaxID=1843768 RepID=UPI0007C1A73A|nr:putative capsid protein [Duck faeces associated circular DNA virus 1]ANC51549.1 putative capsid protein [Duck faeces associated circular DNA virus 1]
MLGYRLREKQAKEARGKGVRRTGALVMRQRSRLAASSVARMPAYIRPTTNIYQRSGDKKGMDTDILGVSTIASATASSAGVGVLNLIQTGSGSWNRVGRKIFPKSVRLRYGIDYTYSNDGDQTYPLSVRVLLVWDANPSGGAKPLFTEMFKDTDQTGAETTSWRSGPAYDAMGRFTILRDKVHTFVPEVFPLPVTNGLARSRIDCDEFVPLQQAMETVYSGQNNPMTIADIYSGALYIVSICDSSPPIGYGIQFSPYSWARLRYTD